jgi:hypothetical protein
MFIETKLVLQAQSQCVTGRPLLAPIYRWPVLKDLVGFYTNSPCHGGLHVVSLFEYNICRLLSWAYISMGFNPNISQGYNATGPGGRTLVTWVMVALPSALFLCGNRVKRSRV